jgi:hypothetical protein
MTLPRWWPFAAVATVGVGFAALQYVFDSRDRLVFSVPILVLTTVILLVMLLARRGGDDLEQMAEELGLRDDGVVAVPPVTPILSGVRTAHVLSGRLPDHGPRVRVTRIGRRLVAISETSATELGPVAADFVDHHPLEPRAGVEEGLLVVDVDAGVGGHDLLQVVSGVHDRF